MTLKQQIECGAAMALVSLLVHTSTQAENTIPDEYRIGGFAIGCQAYSFNQYSAFEAIEKTASAGGKVIEFYPGQKLSKEQPDLKVDHNAADEVIDQLQAKLKKHNLKAVNYGVVGLPPSDDGCRKVFEFAKKMGLLAITAEPAMEQMDMLEKLVKEYDIKLAIHNHPKRPNDANYKVWDPEYVLSMVKDRDSRLGSCADTGHWMRSGIQPVDALKILEGRIISSHLKDLNALSSDGHDVPYGTGKANIAGILNELRRQGFTGNISIEYEYNWNNSTPEIAQCIGFVRGFTTPRGQRRSQ